MSREGCGGGLLTCSCRASCAGGDAPNTPRSAFGGRAMGAGGAGALGNVLAKLLLIASCLVCGADFVILGQSLLCCFHVVV